MIFLHTLLLVFALAPSMQEMLREYRLQLKADALYEHRAYSGAESAFRQIAILPAQKGSASASFNLACALYMQGKYPESATLFSLSAKSGETQQEIKVKALFNEGNALAMRAVASNPKAEKQLLFRQSLNRFKAVLLTDPGENDAKINYEIVRRYLDELERPKQGASSPEKKSTPPPPGGISQETAARLLENARLEESALMQRLPQPGKAAAQGGKNNQDW